MIVGIPKEVKDHENRVGLVPGGAKALVGAGHTVVIESGAGRGSGFADGEYTAAGAKTAATAAEVWAAADMVVKVKEPVELEFGFLREGLLLFTYLHLAPLPVLTRMLLERKVTGIAYETIEDPDGSLPLLTPMSEVAGRMSIQIGARYLERPQGGRGVLLSGVPGVPPAEVVILGGGVVGLNAAKIAVGLGARVTILERSASRMRFLDDIFQGRASTQMSTAYNIEQALEVADLVVGAVLVPGATAPRLVTREMLRRMKSGAVVVDVAVDQGGCFETTRTTTHSDPVYEVDGVLHYGVANMPGAVPRTSTFALTNVTLPYIVSLANLGLVEAVRRVPGLAPGVNTYRGALTCPPVASAQGLSAQPLERLLGAAAGVRGTNSPPSEAGERGANSSPSKKTG